MSPENYRLPTTVRFEIGISCMFSVRAHYTTTVEIDREEWEEMSAEQRELYMKEECERVAAEQVDVAWKQLDA